MNLDIERSRREGFKFGAKLVRGAYMYLERQRAQDLKYPSPVWASLEETHANYNRWGPSCVCLVPAAQHIVPLVRAWLPHSVSHFTELPCSALQVPHLGLIVVVMPFISHLGA